MKLGVFKLMVTLTNELVRMGCGILGATKSLLVCGVLVSVLAGCSSITSNTQRAEPVAKSEDVESALRLADNLRDRGELTTAIAIYQQAANRTDNVEALTKLGHALSANGAKEQAAGVFRRAVSKAPEDPEALLGLGVAYLELGNVDRSIHYLDQLIQQGNSSNLNRYSALGAALDIDGQHDRALATYQAGLEIEPNNLDLKTNLALSHALNDRFDAAINVMSEVTESLDAQVSHQRNMVLILALAGKSREAVAMGYRRLGENETRAVLSQASAARGLTNAADRARAMIGLS